MNNQSSVPLRILHVNTHDIAGGAAKTAYNLLRVQRQRGHRVWMAVGKKLSQDPDVSVIRNDMSACGWERLWTRIQSRLVYWNHSKGVPGLWRMSRAARLLGNPSRWWDEQRGIEDFHFPGTRCLLQLPPEPPDIVHLHNLHGGYFDLRFLPALTRQIPVIVTLHDEWLLTGHCAYSLRCERWKIGCGLCPDLTIYPSIQRDATALNFRRKRQIYRQSKLHIVTPCKWLLLRSSEVMFENQPHRLIPYGIDQNIFRPADQSEMRSLLGIPHNKIVILFLGAFARKNTFKDYPTFEAAVHLLGKTNHERFEIVTVGDNTNNTESRVGNLRIVIIPYQVDSRKIAAFYQAADVFVHTTRADNSPLTILESLSCGTPVIATSVGGIPEQVRGLRGITGAVPEHNIHDMDKATGLLVPAEDPETLATVIDTITQRADIRRRLSVNAVRDSQARFNLETCVDAYLNWYREIIENYRRNTDGANTK